MSLSRVPLLSSLLSAMKRLAARRRTTRLHARSRHELHGMSDHELMDVGLGRSELPEWLRRRVPTAPPGTDSASRRCLHGAPLRRMSVDCKVGIARADRDDALDDLSTPHSKSSA